jgi:NAD(P)H-flavin reductase/ferredoxin
MARVRYAGEEYELKFGESVLDCLLRSGVSISYSCRSGVCQSCLVKATKGTVPEQAQAGLKDTLRAQGYFLACRCEPDDDLAVAQGEDQRVAARIRRVENLGSNVLRLRIEPISGFDYRAGQYISLFRDDGLARSYSLASLPHERELELHVRLIPGGAMSEWLRREAGPDTPVAIQGPAGNCFYFAGEPDQPLLLAGTGTGLAPLYGIARDALGQGHRGPVWLFHGAPDPGGLYLQDELWTLAARHANFHYVPSVLRDGGNEMETGTLDGSILARFPRLEGWKAYLCGDPALVNSLRKKAFLAGAASRSIYADAFLSSAPRVPVAHSSVA